MSGFLFYKTTILKTSLKAALLLSFSDAYAVLSQRGVSDSRSLAWEQKALIAAAMTTGSFFFDENIRDGVKGWSHESSFLKLSMRVSERYGGLVAPALGLLSYPALSVFDFENRYWLNVSRDAFYSMLLYTMVSSSLKFVVGRHRPYQSDESDRYSMFKWGYTSFPSGHTGAAFAFSTALALHSRSHVWRGALWTMASLVGLARIYEDKHWLSDTVAGAALGSFSALWVHNYFMNEESVESQQSVLMPYVDRGTLGLSYARILY